jgi:hypothetical protein
MSNSKTKRSINYLLSGWGSFTNDEGRMVAVVLAGSKPDASGRRIYDDTASGEVRSLERLLV